MITHNIGFYEDLTKIIFELSSNTHLISSAAETLDTVRAWLPNVLDFYTIHYCRFGNFGENFIFANYPGDTRSEFRIVGGASKISVCFSGNISVSHN